MRRWSSWRTVSAWARGSDSSEAALSRSTASGLDGATDQALADGYSGLRVGAEVSGLVAILRPGDESVTLNLGKLEFIDRHGLRAPVEHADRAAAAGGLSIERRPYLVERLCGVLGLKL